MRHVVCDVTIAEDVFHAFKAECADNKTTPEALIHNFVAAAIVTYSNRNSKLARVAAQIQEIVSDINR